MTVVGQASVIRQYRLNCRKRTRGDFMSTRPSNNGEKEMPDQNEATITIIPAAPGWYVSALYDGEDCLTDDPIVAWEITRYDARPIPGTAGRREPIRRYLLPISTNNELNANAAPDVVGWLLRDPTGRYHEWSRGRADLKFDTAEKALAYLARQHTVEPIRRPIRSPAE
jgi:hypothetical protein